MGGSIEIFTVGTKAVLRLETADGDHRFIGKDLVSRETIDDVLTSPDGPFLSKEDAEDKASYIEGQSAS